MVSNSFPLQLQKKKGNTPNRNMPWTTKQHQQKKMRMMTVLLCHQTLFVAVSVKIATVTSMTATRKYFPITVTNKSQEVFDCEVAKKIYIKLYNHMLHFYKFEKYNMMTAMTCYLPPSCMIQEMNHGLDVVEKTYNKRMEEDNWDGDVVNCRNVMMSSLVTIASNW